MGSPTTRNRIFIFIIKKSLMLRSVQKDFGKFVQDMAESFHMDTDLSWILGYVDHQETISVILTEMIIE